VTAVDIPRRILAYAEVVVTLDDNVAHRPAVHITQTGTRSVWSSEKQQMVEVPVTGASYYPGCQGEPDDDHPAPLIANHSAGWADQHLGSTGCRACWPGEEN
jgi:hypothetical protein